MFEKTLVACASANQIHQLREMAMTMERFAAAILLSAVCGGGCGESGAPPREPAQTSLVTHRSDEIMASATLNQMLAVARKGDWKSYVDDHYGEQFKFRSPADRDALVRRFEQNWGPRVVEGLSRAAKLPVLIDGDQALFMDGEETVLTLYRSEEQSWKFHL